MARQRFPGGHMGPAEEQRRTEQQRTEQSKQYKYNDRMSITAWNYVIIQQMSFIIKRRLKLCYKISFI